MSEENEVYAVECTNFDKENPFTIFVGNKENATSFYEKNNLQYSNKLKVRKWEMNTINSAEVKILTPFQRAERAFNTITELSYYGTKFRLELSSDPQLLELAELFVKNLDHAMNKWKEQ